MSPAEMDLTGNHSLLNGGLFNFIPEKAPVSECCLKVLNCAFGVQEAGF